MRYLGFYGTCMYLEIQFLQELMILSTKCLKNLRMKKFLDSKIGKIGAKEKMANLGGEKWERQ